MLFRGTTAVMLFVAACASSPVAQAGAVELRYELTVRPVEQAVDVSLVIRGLTDVALVRLELPQGFAFVRLPQPLLDEPVTAAADERPVEVRRIDAYSWEFDAGGASQAVVKYRVPQTHRRLEAVGQRDAYEYPYLAEDHGLLVTATLLMHPNGLEVGSIRVALRVPAGWPVIAPWPAAGENEFAPPTIHAAVNDLLAVGHWQTQAVQVGDFTVQLAVAPGQPGLANRLTEPIRRIVENELMLFDRPAVGQYLFVVGRPDSAGLGGSPKTNSMTLTVEPRLVPAAATHLSHLIAHEFFHTWAAHRVHLGDELRWLNEGVTDYYAYLVSARAGLLDWPEFADELGLKMRACASSSLRGKVSLVEAGGPRFFSGREAYDLTYAGGLLVGAWLDQAIRRHSPGRSLDDLMRALLNDPRWQAGAATVATPATASAPQPPASASNPAPPAAPRSASPTPGPTLDDLLTLTHRFAGDPAARKLRAFVTEPFAFDPVAEFAAMGITVRRESVPAALDLRANFEQTRVGPIDPADAAYLLGLRTGDEVLSVNGASVADERAIRAAWRNPLNGQLELRIRREDQELTFSGPVPMVERYEVPDDVWK